MLCKVKSIFTGRYIKKRNERGRSGLFFVCLPTSRQAGGWEGYSLFSDDMQMRRVMLESVYGKQYEYDSVHS